MPDVLEEHKPEAQMPTTSEALRSPEAILPEVDELSRETAKSLYVIDRFIDSGEELPESDNPVLNRYRQAVESLRDMDQEGLLQLVDSKRKFRNEAFSVFEVSVDPPGTIHIELGTPDDLKKFRNILGGGGLGDIFAAAGLDDSREAEHFAAQYFSPHLFGSEGNYLGVIVTIRGQIEDKQQKRKALRHENSHAILQKVIRPACQKTVVDIDLYTSASEADQRLKSLGKEKALRIAEHLDILPSPDVRPHTQMRIIGRNLKDEQFLLDELRAFSFNFPPLKPKFQITDLDLTDDDTPSGAQLETVKKYFQVWLLHLKARLFSTEARCHSLAILGSTLSLRQAQRLLEAEAPNWVFDTDEGNESFAGRFRALSFILQSKDYMDFNHEQGGELVSHDHARKIIIPDQTLTDAEIERRWGSLEEAPDQFQRHYRSIYPLYTSPPTLQK